ARKRGIFPAARRRKREITFLPPAPVGLGSRPYEAERRPPARPESHRAPRLRRRRRTIPRRGLLGSGWRMVVRWHERERGRRGERRGRDDGDLRGRFSRHGWILAGRRRD